MFKKCLRLKVKGRNEVERDIEECVKVNLSREGMFCLS